MCVLDLASAVMLYVCVGLSSSCDAVGVAVDGNGVVSPLPFWSTLMCWA